MNTVITNFYNRNNDDREQATRNVIKYAFRNNLNNICEKKEVLLAMLPEFKKYYLDFIRIRKNTYNDNSLELKIVSSNKL